MLDYRRRVTSRLLSATALLLLLFLLPRPTPVQGQAPSTEPSVPRGVVRVACMGDSITAGARAGKDESYPAQLAELLGEDFVVRNFGIGGATLIKVGSPSVWQALPRTLAFQPHVVIISLGTNDTVAGGRRNWERIDAFQTDYQALIDELAALPTGPRILVCTPTAMVLETPDLSPARLTDLSERRRRLQELCAKIRTLTAEQDPLDNVGRIELNALLQGKPELLTPADGVHPNAKGYRAIAEALLPYVRRAGQRPEDGIISRGSSRTLEQIDVIGETIPPITYRPPADRGEHLPRTMAKLRDGGVLRVVMLGDSLINDTSRSAWELLVQRRHPGCRVVKITSVRGSTGCWWYRENGRIGPFVVDHDPDLLIIGGISQRDDIEAIEDVITQVRDAGFQTDIFLQSGPFGRVDPHDPDWQPTVPPDADDYRAALGRLAERLDAEYLDLQGAWGQYIRANDKPVEWFKRDVVHANEKGEQILGRILEAYFVP